MLRDLLGRWCVCVRVLAKRKRTSSFLALFLFVLALVNGREYIAHLLALKKIGRFESQSRQQRSSPREEEMMRDLLRAFDVIAKANDIPYFLYGGSLIGYFRNNSLMPWDDDLDVSMPWEKYDAFVETLNTTMPTYGMWRHSPPDHYLFKIYSKTFYSVYDKDRNWPFLDIFLHNTTKLTITIGSSYHYSKRKVFPARMGDFLGMKVPVPKSVRHVLKKTYGPEVFTTCVSNYNDHRKLLHLKTHSIPCRQLSFSFSFRNIDGWRTRPVQADPKSEIFLRQADDPIRMDVLGRKAATTTTTSAAAVTTTTTTTTKATMTATSVTSAVTSRGAAEDTGGSGFTPDPESGSTKL